MGEAVFLLLWAVGQSQVWVLRSWREESTMTASTTSIRVVKGAPHNGCHQGLSPQSGPQPPTASLGDQLGDQLVGLGHAPSNYFFSPGYLSE